MVKALTIILGLVIISGIGLAVYIFWPVARVEIQYGIDQTANVKYTLGGEQLDTFEKILTPVNTDFSIIIPKIAAVAPITANVDPNNPYSYLPVLKQGIAQADKTSLPGQSGNVYLFAHSDDAFYNVSFYNTVFFLLGKLVDGDVIDVFYGGRLTKYEVYDKKIVDPKSVQYLGILPGDLNPDGADKTLTLQTDYPPGTTFKRLLILAKQTAN